MALFDELLIKNYQIEIELEHKYKFLFFFNKKKKYEFKFSYPEGTFKDFLIFTRQMEFGAIVDEWLFNFLSKYQVGEKTFDEKFFKIFLQKKETFTKTLDYVLSTRFSKLMKNGQKKKSSKTSKDKPASDSMFIGYLQRYSNETIASILEMPFSTILYIKDGLDFINRAQTKDGQKKNERILRSRQTKEEAGEITDEHITLMEKEAEQARDKKNKDQFAKGQYKKVKI